MKILQINTVCGIGSTGRITTNLYQLLKDRGHECLIAYGRGKPVAGIPTLRIGSKLEVILHALYTRLTDRHGYGSKWATKRFIKKVKAYQPDLIHLHNLHGYYLNLPLLFMYFKETNLPVIWSLYDCWAFTGHCCHFDYLGCEKWKTGCHNCIQKKEYPASLLLDHSAKNYESKCKLITKNQSLVLVTPSRWLRGQLKESCLKELPSLIIPSGINLSIFRPTPSNLRANLYLENRFLVLGICNGFHKFKGIEYYNQLAESLPPIFQVVLVGVEEKQKHQFSGRILLLPRTNKAEELAMYYTVADVFVNPTLQETQGLTNIEALACGTGVVTFQSGGSAESIDESCGIVIKRGDFDGLLNGVIKACEVPFSPEACIQRATFYNKERLSLEYLKLYHVMIDR